MKKLNVLYVNNAGEKCFVSRIEPGISIPDFLSAHDADQGDIIWMWDDETGEER